MWNAFLANLEKMFIEVRRYYFNTISSIATLLIFFYLLFFGVKAVGGPSINLSSTLDGIIVGYFMWIVFIFSFQGVAWGIIEEAQRGTLEQVFTSPIAFEYQMLFRMVSEFLFNNVFLAIPLMYFAAFTTGRKIGFDLATLLYLMIGGTISALGIGMILGGIALIFKRVSSFIQIVTFGSLSFTMFETQSLWHRLLPMSQASSMMRALAIDGTRLHQFRFSDHAILWLVALGYLSVGFIVFRAFERRAMVVGSLSQY
ncbi:MAG: ABC-2 type transporter [Thermotoga sp. 50_1627]|uniref:ABC transporter permease n=1 Tax=Pseudothermotoga sp. TaxID=2033661 RepID=UPI00076D6757|nr:MAG: ABC-2 type transporter [Thermotoga sp. 50_64]KUK25818.1 MAG: ABC-2 type transporter [Thermotoga sp. 50_1627]MBC7115503.1 ABC transporter permease [Pseudothermotoga sp.]MDK2922891.1 type transport system permease protein [Pseudothermotoga sp.]HBT40079.1 ABC transporter [Pseudothermotoga sp.]